MIIQKEEKEVKVNKSKFGLDADEMFKAGLHFGHKKSKTNPKMKEYLYGVRNGIHLINLEKTIEKFEDALSYIKSIVSEGKTVLFIGTKIESRDLVKKVAQECGCPYVAHRWLGGTFTNFTSIKKRVDYFIDLEKQKEEGELIKYTKKEIVKIDRELKNLEVKFGGLKNLSKLPDVVFIASIKEDDLAVKEAGSVGIKMIGIANTGANPTLVDFPIPANDSAVSSLKYILGKLKDVILKTTSKIKYIEEAENKKVV
ncbi:MAG: 30S ribosomal protein S2 [Patescibacteria group bacterium]